MEAVILRNAVAKDLSDVDSVESVEILLFTSFSVEHSSHLPCISPLQC